MSAARPSHAEAKTDEFCWPPPCDLPPAPKDWPPLRTFDELKVSYDSEFDKSQSPNIYWPDKHGDLELDNDTFDGGQLTVHCMRYMLPSMVFSGPAPTSLNWRTCSFRIAGDAAWYALGRAVERFSQDGIVPTIKGRDRGDREGSSWKEDVRSAANETIRVLAELALSEGSIGRDRKPRGKQSDEYQTRFVVPSTYESKPQDVQVTLSIKRDPEKWGVRKSRLSPFAAWYTRLTST